MNPRLIFINAGPKGCRLKLDPAALLQGRRKVEEVPLVKALSSDSLFWLVHCTRLFEIFHQGCLPDLLTENSLSFQCKNERCYPLPCNVVQKEGFVQLISLQSALDKLN